MGRNRITNWGCNTYSRLAHGSTISSLAMLSKSSLCGYVDEKRSHTLRTVTLIATATFRILLRIVPLWALASGLFLQCRSQPRASNQPRDEGLLHDLRLGFESSAAPMAIAAAQPPLDVEQAHAAVRRRAELEYLDRLDPGLVAAGLALRTESPSRVDVVAEPHR